MQDTDAVEIQEDTLGLFGAQIFAQCTTRAGRRVSTVLLLVPLFSGEGTVPACFALPSVNRLSMFLHLENQIREEKRRALVFGVQQGQQDEAQGAVRQAY